MNTCNKSLSLKGSCILLFLKSVRMIFKWILRWNFQKTFLNRLLYFINLWNVSKHFPGGTVGICFPMQGTQVPFPGLGSFYMPQSNQAHAPQLLNLCSRAREPQPPKPRQTTACPLHQEKPTQCNWGRPMHSTEDPAQPQMNQ